VFPEAPGSLYTIPFETHPDVSPSFSITVAEQGGAQGHEFARAQRITQIFMGRSQPPPWWQRFRYTIVQQVVRQARDMQITIVAERRR
jgi:K+-sensing histidine kinase KdpD